MATFESIHADAITGKLVMFDRLLFKGYLGLMDGTRFEWFLNSQHVLLKDFGDDVKRTTEAVKAHVMKIAEASGRSVVYLATGATANRGWSKEDIARQTAERDGITEGLITVLSAVEPCQAFQVRWSPKRKRLAAVRCPRKCLHDDFYYIDCEFGFMHVRLQSWWPFTIQIYINGREWLWVTDQCEIATDIMFKRRAALAAVMPDFYETAILLFSSDDVMRFLGRKPHPSFQGEVVTSDKWRRQDGRRVKHRIRRHSIKMYDKHSVLRSETTINNPNDFKVLKSIPGEHGSSLRWVPMAKGVSNLWRYRQVGEGANTRYLEAMANVTLKGEAVRELDSLCRSHLVKGRRVARLQPIGPADCQVFQAILHGEHLVRGFRNRDLAALVPQPPRNETERRRRSARLSRWLAKLRGH